MIIEINAISAAEAREIGSAYREERERIENLYKTYQKEADKQLIIAATAIIEKKIMPRIIEEAKTSVSCTFTALKDHWNSNDLDDFLSTINKYNFDYGFYVRLKIKDDNLEYHFSRADIMGKVFEILRELNYKCEYGYTYSQGYYKDYDFKISW